MSRHKAGNLGAISSQAMQMAAGNAKRFLEPFSSGEFMPQLLRILAAMVIGVLVGYASIFLLARLSPDPISILMEII